MYNGINIAGESYRKLLRILESFLCNYQLTCLYTHTENVCSKFLHTKWENR